MLFWRRSLLFALILLADALVFGRPGHAQGLKTRECYLGMLLEHSMASKERRLRTLADWLSYKNEPSSLESREIHLPHERDRETRVVRTSRGDFLMKSYDEKVVSLRRGDTVTFGERRFVLGSFLGAGNASHVWEIEGWPEAVLRIPFFSKPMRKEYGESLETMRAWMQRMESYPKVANKGVRTAKRLESDPIHHSYLVMSRVNSAERLDHWMKSPALIRILGALATEMNLQKSGVPAAIAREGAIRMYGYTGEREFFEESRKLERLKEIRVIFEASKDGDDLQYEQLLWDSNPEVTDWVLVDW